MNTTEPVAQSATQSTEKLGALELLFFCGQTAASLPESVEDYGWIELLGELLKIRERVQREILARWVELGPEELQEKVRALGLELPGLQLQTLVKAIAIIHNSPLAYKEPGEADPQSFLET